MAPPTHLRDLFSPVELLPAGTRRRLAASLATPGRAPALLPAELAGRPLPAGIERRAAVADEIGAGLTPEVVATLAPWRVHAVVPGLEAAAATPACRLTGPPRALTTLDRHGIEDVAALGRCTVAQIRSWAGVGPALAASIVGVAVTTASRAPVASAEPAPHHPVTASTPSPLLDELDLLVAAAGDERDLGVLELRSLRLSDRPGLGEIGDALGVCDERVRQLQRGAERRVSAAIEPGSSVRAEAASVAVELGEVTTVEEVCSLLAERGLPPPPDVRSLLLIWVAGPYLPIPDHPGWIAVEPPELVEENRRVLHEDGGVRSVEHLEDDLTALGMSPRLVDAWLERQPVRRVDDLVVALSGSPAQRLERALAACGRAMSTTELASWVDSADSRTTTLTLERDRRFVCVGPGRYELAEWGSPPFTGSAPVRGELESECADAQQLALLDVPVAETGSTARHPLDHDGARLVDVTEGTT